MMHPLRAFARRKECSMQPPTQRTYQFSYSPQKTKVGLLRKHAYVSRVGVQSDTHPSIKNKSSVVKRRHRDNGSKTQPNSPCRSSALKGPPAASKGRLVSIQ